MDKNTNKQQTHTHEFLGSTMPDASPYHKELLHSPRFAGVTGEVIPTAKSHVHLFHVNTDFFGDHFHTMKVETGEAIPVFDQRKRIIGHTHGFTGITSFDDQHRHTFKGSTLIEDPSGPIS